jgi:uncharacterized membrane protein YdjX (TVP38/TMEM64 family)
VGGHALVRGKLDRKWLAVGALAAAAALVVAMAPLEDWSERLESALAGMGFSAGLLAFMAVSVIAGLALAPAWIFAVAAGAVFGMGWGFAAALASTFAAALAAFLLARYVARGWFERAARRSAVFKSVNAAVAKDGWRVVALLRLSPVLPSGVKSYFLGLTHVRLLDYATASLAGMLPGTLLKVYIGSAGRGALSEGGLLNWSVFLLGAAATVGLALLVGRQARKKLGL